MHITTLSGIVENGQIRLPDNVCLPEKAVVYIVIPGIQIPPAQVVSPRLRYANQAGDFQKEVVEENGDAGV